MALVQTVRYQQAALKCEKAILKAIQWLCSVNGVTFTAQKKINKTINARRLTDVAGNTHGLNCFLQGQATYCSTAQNKET